MPTYIKGNDTSTFGGNVDVPQIITDAPLFSAYATSSTTLSASAWVKVIVNAEEYDTNSNYDITNYRFTPTVAGYYMINGAVQAVGASSGWFLSAIYKNGGALKFGSNYSSSGFGPDATVTGLVYLNGSTDYVELYSNHSSGSTTTTGGAYTYFQGVLVRAV